MCWHCDKTTDYRPLDMSKISLPTAFRLLKIWKAFKENHSVEELYEKTVHTRAMPLWIHQAPH